jgi:type I restriction enzyme S subunit
MDLTRFDTLEQLPTKVKESQILEIGDIIISLTGNVGRACMVVSENCLLNQRVEKINSINKDYEGFCYFYIRSNETYNKMLALAKGSAQQNLSPVELSNLRVAFNQNNKSIFKFFNNLRLQLMNYQIQNIKLANIRDLLLPKLMSGEIEVPDME